MSKLALGTAQFGIDYGINNDRGKIPFDEVFAILDEALNNGIDTLDTAVAYGDSESIIGNYHKKTGREFKIISKLPKCSAIDVGHHVPSSLNKLNIDRFYGYLIHNFKHYSEDPKIFNALEKLKGQGKIEKIGFSLYYPEELEHIFSHNLKIDIVQLPYNVFDQRFAAYFKKLKEMGVEIHVRSVFLQGLFFKNNGNLNNYFAPIKDKISELRGFSQTSEIPLSLMLLNYALLNENIDKVVVGVDNPGNLEELLGSVKYSDHSKKIMDWLNGFREDDEKIILPFNWKLEAVR